jgi:hypothetical protein
MADEHKKGLIDRIQKSFEETKRQLDGSDKVEEKKEKKKKKTSKKKPPTKEVLNKWYGHIKKIRVEFYIIETKIKPRCPYCEEWKSNSHKKERENFFLLHELLNLSDENVFATEIPCDWNALHGEEYELNGIQYMYPPDLTLEGGKYYTAYGMDIETFPSLRIKMKTTKYKKAQKTLEVIFQGVGTKKMEWREFEIEGQRFRQQVPVLHVRFLSPLLKYLRTLDVEYSNMPVHDKYSIFLGQYHRHRES